MYPEYEVADSENLIWCDRRDMLIWFANWSNLKYLSVPLKINKWLLPVGLEAKDIDKPKIPKHPSYEVIIDPLVSKSVGKNVQS